MRLGFGLHRSSGLNLQKDRFDAQSWELLPDGGSRERFGVICSRRFLSMLDDKEVIVRAEV